MLYTLTTNQIIKQARTKLLELTDEVITSTAILEFLNLTHLEVQIKVLNDDQLEEAALTFSGGLADVPEDFLALYGKPVDQTGHPVRVLKRQDFLRAGNSEKIMTKKGNQFQVKGDVTSATMIYYRAYPALGLGETPQTHALLHGSYVYGIVYRALEDLQDKETAVVYKADFESSLEEKAGLISQLQENAIEADMFNFISIIT